MTGTEEFEGPAPFVSGSDTSEAAAQAVQPSTASMRLKVYEYTESQGLHGATADEVQVALGLTHQTGSARVSELAGTFNRIVRTAMRRKTRSGSPAGVYVADSWADQLETPPPE